MNRPETANTFYPVLLNVHGRRCLVIGGGKIALRKVRTLIGHSAEVVVVSPAIDPELQQLVEDGSVKAICREYRAKDLEGAFLVIAATDDLRINEKVASDSKKRRIPVNVVDKPDISDFIVPAFFKRGDIIVAVSTSGKSPALARKIRNELENELRTEYSHLAVIASDVRSELKKRGMPVSPEEWQSALDLNSLLELIKRGKNKEAKEIMLAKLTSAATRKS
jgi:precorrin-2 dehydrogenase